MQESPVAPAERHEIIDIIRGFALFGVLYANVFWVALFHAFTRQQRAELPRAGWTWAGELFNYLLIEDKFYTLFAILFGIGFSIQLKRAQDSGRNLFSPYVRRLSILLAFGVVHSVAVWHGDILIMYGLVGFLLLFFREASERTVLRWIVGIFMFLLLWTTVSALIDLPSTSAVEMPYRERRAWRLESMTSPRYLDVLHYNWVSTLAQFSRWTLEAEGLVYRLVNIFWRFLIGFYVGRRMILQDVTRHLSLVRRILPWAWALGLLASLPYTLDGMSLEEHVPGGSRTFEFLEAPIETGILCLAVAYACTLVLLDQKPLWRKVLRPFAAVGRMALTNYLMQSVLFVTIYYGIGFGLLGKIGIVGTSLVILGIYGFQMAFSGWWLDRFRFGPLEWLWRSLTYAKVQSIR